MNRNCGKHKTSGGNLLVHGDDSRESTPAAEDDEYKSATSSNENLFQALQIFLLRQNARLLRRLSLQASIANTDFDTFRRWIRQDYEQHRSQLKEASANLFFRNESKENLADIVITFERGCEPELVSELQRALLKDHPTFNVLNRKHYFASFVEEALYVSASDDFFDAFLPITTSDDDDELVDADGNLKQEQQQQQSPVECSSLQRQTILHSILQQWHFDVDQKEDGESFPYLAKYLASSHDDRSSTIERLIEAKGISQVFPLHCDETLTSLKTEWVYNVFSAQPLDKINEYFGIKIAIYFAFIGFYTKYLLYPTLFGLFITYFPSLLLLCHSNISSWFQWCLWLFEIDQTLLNFGFTIFNMFWSTIMLQKWEMRCREHVANWSRTMPFDFALWHGKPSSKVDRSDEGGLNRIIVKYCITFPVLGCSLAITFAIMFQIFHLQTWWDSELVSYPSWTRFVPKVLLALIIYASNYIYYIIAVWLNDKEKYIQQEAKENNLILKLVLFQIGNSFLPLFYLAFYRVDVDRLQEQLAAQLITRQVIGNFNEAVWPFLKESYRIATRKMENKDRDMAAGELESLMQNYETFDDYLEMVVQFGYVMLFAPVFPLAALCALLNNILEIRSDAFKLCFVFQRPFARDQVRSIGEWANVLYYLSVVAIATNCALMAVTGQISRVFGFTSSAHIILSSVAIEHALLLMKWLIPNLLI